MIINLGICMQDFIITSSWDDANPLDIKLSKILKKYHIPATFYIPINNNSTTLDENEIKYISKNFDIGGHTYNHKNLTHLSKKEAYQEIINGKIELEHIIEDKVFSFCYPYGKYNASIKNLVKKAGFSSARTVHQLCYRVPNDLFEIGTTIHVGATTTNHVIEYLKNNRLDNNFNLFFKSIFSNPLESSWYHLSTMILEYVKSHGGIFHLWGHSWEIDSLDAWDQLDKLCNIMSKINKRTLYLDNTELTKYILYPSRHSI